MDGQGDDILYLIDQALAQVLTMNESGAGFTHFAVVQDGIVPNDWFLDVLMEDLLGNGLDMVSSVVPYANDTGCTTTAIDDPSDRYCPTRRLTLNEVFRLSEVFTATDCGYPNHKMLLANECFVVDVTKPWYYDTDENGDFKIRFSNGGRMRRLKDGRIWAMRDDWGFSRDIQGQGAKVAATRRVVLTNDSDRFPYPNQAPWGEWDYDKDTAHKFNNMPISHAARKPVLMGFTESLEFPSVEGMLTDEEGILLSKLSEGKRCLDLAPHCGRAAIWMAKTAREVVLLKPGDDERDLMCRYASDVLKANLKQYGVGNKIMWVQEPKMNASRLGTFWDKFDLVYVDGANVLKGLDAIALAKPLADGGLLVFRDCGDLQNTFGRVAGQEVGTLTVVQPTMDQISKARGLSITNHADCSKIDSEELKAIGIG